MNLWNKEELIAALGDELLQNNLPENLVIDEVVIDGRKATKNGLFIAIKGEKNDGHDFLNQATENGCTTAIIDKLTTYHLPLTTILVKNTFTALYKLAEFSRKRSKAKIIAITGSVGKTGTKEMLKLVFESQGKTFATAGNLNNHIGLPLCLCNFARDSDFGIFEMGMNHAGEIEPLSKLVKPHLALITNVGPVHIEFFKNEEEIAKAKAEIFSGLVDGGICLINADNKHFELLKKLAKNYVSFGEKKPCDYQIIKSETSSANNSVVEAKLKNGNKIYYEIATSQPATIFNSIITVACLDLLGNDFAKGISSMKNLKTANGRGNVIETNNLTIIDDSYNASVLSMRAGLEHAANLKKILGKKRVVAALGDMLELGEKSVELHEEIADYLLQFHIDFAVLVGNNMTQISKNLPTNSYKTFSDSQTASLEIESLLQDGDIQFQGL